MGNTPTCPECGNELRLVRSSGKLTGECLCLKCDASPQNCPICNYPLKHAKADECKACESEWREIAPAQSDKKQIRLYNKQEIIACFQNVALTVSDNDNDMFIGDLYVCKHALYHMTLGSVSKAAEYADLLAGTLFYGPVGGLVQHFRNSTTM